MWICKKCETYNNDSDIFCCVCNSKKQYSYNYESSSQKTQFKSSTGFLSQPANKTEVYIHKSEEKNKCSELFNFPIRFFEKFDTLKRHMEKGGKINSEGNMRISDDGILLRYIGESENVEIPEGIKAIGKYAFFDNKKVKRVMMHDSLKYIGQYAFMKCDNLEAVEFSSNIDTIGQKAFCNCKKLKKLEFPQSLRVLESGSFAGCDEIEEISIPAGVKHIPDYCFYSCKKLRMVYMADSVSTIGEFAFSNCYRLKSVNFSESLRIIENSAFCYCQQIEELIFPISLFSMKNLAFFGCTALNKVSVSMKLNNIKNDSFGCCDNLFKIFIYEFNDPEITLVEMRKGYKLILNILKQISPERAKRYASEHDISKLM